MAILALDTSTRVQSVAVASGGAVLSRQILEAAQRHSETLLPAVDRALREASVPPSRLEAVAVASGPGSFTGLRVGLATAKGLALAAGVPVAGFSSLRLLAEGLAAGAAARAGTTIPAGTAVCALMEAGRGQLYRGLYRVAEGSGSPWRLQEDGDESLIRPEAALAGVPAGSVAGGPLAAGRLEAVLGGASGSTAVVEPPRCLAGILAIQAAWLLEGGAFPEGGLSPNYIRPPDALAGGAPGS